MGVRETGILVSCSDYHIFKKMHLTRAQAMDKYLGVVKAALEQGIGPAAILRTSPAPTFTALWCPSPNS